MIQHKQLLSIVASCLASAATCLGAGILEPSTVLYGRAVNPTSGQPFLLTSGILTWTIAVPNQPDVVLTAELESLAGGAYSYRLDIPHEALSLGTDADQRTVPLSFSDVVFHHSSVEIDGHAARIAVANAEAFAASQTTRGFTHRVDLIVEYPLPDTDGDGLPDWWEDLHGLNKQLNDASADTDGDGRNNLSEFAAGTSPVANNRQPIINTTAIKAWEQGQSGVYLSASDTDSGPGDLTYTITHPPGIGSLCLRTVQTPSGDTWGTPLSSGDTFTQQDVEEGRLVYVHTAAGTEDTSFALSLRDATPDHEPVAAELSVEIRRPNVSGALAGLLESFSGTRDDILDATRDLPPQSARDTSSYLLSKWLGAVTWDASTSTAGVVLRTPSSDVDADTYAEGLAAGQSRDSSHVLIGGLGDDVLTGGEEDDILDGGPGDDMLQGSGGSDVFVFRSATDGNDTIWDFDPDVDRIDISALLSGAAPNLANHVSVNSSGDDVIIGIDVDGNGSGYTDVTIRLVDASATPESSDLYALADSGKLDSGGLELLPCLSISAAADAGEGAQSPGRFVLSRSGSLEEALTVNIIVSGSATNGVDYPRISAQLTFPAGSRSSDVPISPYVDTQVEGTETVEISLQAGSGYTVAHPASAALTIKDPGERIGVKALEPVAAVTPQTVGVFLVTRSGSPAWNTNVLIQVSGTATNGVDYEYIAPVVAMSAWQSSATITVVPKTGATLANGTETVRVKILADPTGNYALEDNVEASVAIVQDAAGLLNWRNANAPDSPDADPDQDGLSNAMEEELGSDPRLCTIVLEQGWNLVSTPRVPAPGQTLQDQLGSAHVGSVWTWSGTGYQVLPPDSPMVPGAAYFVLCLVPSHVDLADTPQADGYRDVRAGWNLVGPIRGGTDQEGTLAGTSIFGFTAEGYGKVAPQDLKPTKGYWLYAPEDGAIVLP